MSKKVVGVGRYLFEESDGFSALVTAWCVVSLVLSVSWLIHEDTQAIVDKSDYLSTALIKPTGEQEKDKEDAKKSGFAALFSQAGTIMKERREKKQEEIDKRAEEYGLKINVKQPETPQIDIAAPQVQVQENIPQEAPKKDADAAVLNLMNN